MKLWLAVAAGGGSGFAAFPLASRLWRWALRRGKLVPVDELSDLEACESDPALSREIEFTYRRGEEIAPITIALGPAGKRTLTAGHHRFAVARRLGFPESLRVIVERKRSR